MRCKSLQLDLGAQSYSIHIGQNLIAEPSLFESCVKGRQVLVVTNDIVAPLYLQKVLNSLDRLEHPADSIKTLILPDGESHKTFTTLQQILDELVQCNFDRQSLLIALGGGVVGDMTGFAAAIYQRGVSFVQVPTTLLSQVDASVGGKTAINHPMGKNLIGAFHQPKAVIIDTDTLGTLPPREYAAGIAEVIKYGCIMDHAFLTWLEQNINAINQQDPATNEHLIYQSCLNKAKLVSADEKEAGIRSHLNFGHTFGHAIENALGYGTWLHGEAVAMGMLLATKLSQLLGLVTEADLKRLEKLVSDFNLPTKLPDHLDNKTLIDIMQRDKKVQQHKIGFIILKSLGQAIMVDEVNEPLLEQTLNYYR